MCLSFAKDLDELPRVWLTSNETPWDRSVLDKDDFITVPSCWDGESEFTAATNCDAQEQDELNQFEGYVYSNKKQLHFYFMH